MWLDITDAGIDVSDAQNQWTIVSFKLFSKKRKNVPDVPSEKDFLKDVES